jgi:Rps23 Pro-64 3,4-dihydroxylase Tpa1-like proline 4-hydroxylase
VTWIDFSRWNPAELRAAWTAARPFPHVILDDLIAEDRLQELRNAVAREPHTPNIEHFYEMMASGLTVKHEVLADFHAALGSPPALDFLGAVSGKTLTRVEMRSYVYLAGSFLLPHSDHRAALGRLVAYAYYLLPRETCTGGELELFDCDVESGDVVATRPGPVIEPRGNRMVLFDVSPSSLHQVREVTAGGRVSLSGWFFGDAGTGPGSA